MAYYRRVVKRRSACVTDDEIGNLLAKAREHAADMAKANAVWKEPVLCTRILCFWCRHYHSPAEVEKCMATPRPSVSVPSPGLLPSGVSQGQLLSQFSELWEFLTGTAYADGTKRTPGQISLKLSSGGLQVTLTDPTTATYCCLTLPTLDDLFLAVEIGLKEGNLAWRPSGYAKPRK